MASCIVRSGVCGFVTKITAGSEDGQSVVFTIESDCPRVQAMAAGLTEMDFFATGFGPMSQTEPYQFGDQCKLHAACPVPCGLLKAAEVAAGLALPAKVEIEFE